jgi:hypothetical protein
MVLDSVRIMAMVSVRVRPSRAEYQRQWRAARHVRRGGEPHSWVRLGPRDVAALRRLNRSMRAIAREAQLSHHTVARAMAGGLVYWSTRDRLRALVR